ncbi:bifunctional 3,4-dihydroxy-2-butanone-4-phosphate synthase/GTP cyclohydrolase II [Propionimicrobium sp. BV2F7]|uniref:bifunctional 3,4-dihydroxy-2-butanone-4-phosphate synthase/GTP cyclohydrolase II n=1 Tax=Propionimicrobium sp. BV2F7 TaxID=1111131 RepID=UPI0003D7992A|nr:bifunctional 3,4-dihydroxy-2-butanone-4-phosphate synthase/GTP cyclohydrolase II [Propionimicrobium sp. BV2F7]ETJ96871.1 3,4-dihydroxy-2-butanone-4-phosphate synthase RibB / GTP cyclohydrolase II RibA multi-domain protein [Propionimicrobium sp. BV2F7]
MHPEIKKVNGFATIESAFEQLRAGRPILVLDDQDRENEGDAVLPAFNADPKWVAWMVRHTSGYLCAPMPESLADKLGLPLMVENSQDPKLTAYTFSCDAAEGVTTGISAADRATTLRALADPNATPQAIIRPGHILPLRAREGGVFTRRGHTEATVDFCRLAGLPPVGAIGELVHDDGRMMRTPDVLALGEDNDLAVVTIDELEKWRERYDRVELVAKTVLPTHFGKFKLLGYRDLRTGTSHVALISGELGDNPVVRVHSECLTGDALGSMRCDCGEQLELSQEIIGKEGGVLVYLRGHEGRGVGLMAKLEAYSLQDNGADTVDAQTLLGMPIDAREYGAAVAILQDLGVDKVQLLTNNPEKSQELVKLGIAVSKVRPIVTGITEENARYLSTKRDRMGHKLPEHLVPKEA